ncbi:MAG: AraC family transcriptional regulator [Acidobacteria bacterium]|nr:AraC family transcriptional regulator [Acidobacteriota bacterium]
MRLTRLPRLALRPFVELLWAVDDTTGPWSLSAARERVLPTGRMHLAVRLSDAPVRLYVGANSPDGWTVGHAVVGGARTTSYIRDVSSPSRSVGAQLRPGAAWWLFGVPADTLAGRHTSLGDLRGRPTGELRDRLRHCTGLEHQLDCLESWLSGRLPRVHSLHPAVAHALERFGDDTPPVQRVVAEVGLSHRRFIEVFRNAVGLAPKAYCRVLRFRRAVHLLGTGLATNVVEVALAAGYADQSHFTREFSELAGLTPGEYRRMAPRLPHHVRV